MKTRLFLISAIFSFALTGAAVAEKPTPTPVPASEAAVQAVPPNPETAAATPTPATEEKKPAAEEKIAASEATATPTPAGTPKEPAADVDLLPEPADASLTAPLEPPPADESLPADEPSPSDLPNPDDTLIPLEGEVSDIPPPPIVTENKFDQERKLNVRYQEVKLQALKDAAVRSLHEQAESATTDEGNRQALREYYRVLFAKMIAIDSNLKEKCDTMQEAYLRRLGQYRVEPTIPLNPPPTPEPLESAQTSPTPKAKAKRGE